MNIEIKKKNLKELLKEYEEECLKNKETHSYRGLLEWLKQRGKNITYFEGLRLKLLEYNNNLFDKIELLKSETKK